MVKGTVSQKSAAMGTGDYWYPVRQWVPMPNRSFLNAIAPLWLPIVSCNWRIGYQWKPVRKLLMLTMLSLQVKCFINYLSFEIPFD
jgi:hypothetical protein